MRQLHVTIPVIWGCGGMADAQVLGTCEVSLVRVRLPPSPPFRRSASYVLACVAAPDTQHCAAHTPNPPCVGTYTRGVLGFGGLGSGERIRTAYVLACVATPDTQHCVPHAPTPPCVARHTGGLDWVVLVAARGFEPLTFGL